MTGFRFISLHFSSYDNASTSSSVKFLPFALEIIWNSSGHLKSAHDKVINQVGIPNCLTIATTSYINLCQYGGDPGICRKNKYAWSWDIRFWMICVFDLTCDAVKVWPWTFLHAILIASDTFFCSIINCAKNRYSGLVAKRPL